MAVYRCDSCGATTDTEATARAFGRSPGYGPGTQIVYAAPQKCDVCGSVDITEVTVEPMAEPAVAAPHPERRDPCKKCGAEFSDESLFCHRCGDFRRVQFFNLLVMLGTLVFMGIWVWVSLVDRHLSDRPQWFCAAFPILFSPVILVYLVRTVWDSARALRSARQGRGRAAEGPSVLGDDVDSSVPLVTGTSCDEIGPVWTEEELADPSSAREALLSALRSPGDKASKECKVAHIMDCFLVGTRALAKTGVLACGCGYPTTSVLTDTSLFPEWELLDRKPTGPYSQDYFCPHCGKFVMSQEE